MNELLNERGLFTDSRHLREIKIEDSCAVGQILGLRAKVLLLSSSFIAPSSLFM
ncbi:hypothetical protein HPP92_005888 [Vanilla planifolia]|uniref:Uncharacterized protein n=1 Tax=Vanilla planifolia TaxID=51239 RepID=A0A835VD13_VANPL|nr:hypothetical protein HPP92_005888 [Vanilla planifolia]